MLWRTVSYWRNKKAEVTGYRGSLISRKTYFLSIWNYYMYLKIDYRNLTLLFLVYLDAAELLVPTHHTLENRRHNRLEYSTQYEQTSGLLIHYTKTLISTGILCQWVWKVNNITISTWVKLKQFPYLHLFENPVSKQINFS